MSSPSSAPAADALLRALDDRTLLRTFDAGTLGRARSYADGDSIGEIELVAEDADEVELLATVAGTDVLPYDVSVLVLRGRRGIEVHGECSCPVGWNCKHAAAVLLVVRRGSPAALPPAAGWSHHLDEVLREPVLAPRSVKPLALRFEVEHPSAPARPQPAWVTRSRRPLVRVRPVTTGARGTWVKNAVSWTSLPRGAAFVPHEPAQVAVLMELVEARMHVYAAVANPDLADFGPGVWAMLHRARDTGVQLVGDGDLPTVELLDEPVSLVTDVRADAAAGDHRVEVGVRVGDRWWAGEQVLVVGRHGHGVALVDPATGRLTLAPLDRLAPEPVRRLLEGPAPVRIPADQTDRFVADYLPRLRRHVPVTSSDVSVALPEEEPPVLVLTVAWGGAGRATVSWGWRYPGDSTLERPDQERAVLAGLELGEVADGLLREPDGSLVDEVELRGSRLLELVATVLPALREHPSVEVLETGDALDYRPADEEPEISFDLVPSDDHPDRVDWLDLEVVIVVDGERVPLTAVLEALTLGQDWVFLPSGLYLPADHPAFARLAEAVRAAAELAEDGAGDGAIRVGKGDLGVLGELADLGVVDEQAARWVQAAQQLRGITELPQVEPAGLATELRGYQLEGFRWLAFLRGAGLGGILADDMGLGKTLQALALVAHARAEGSGPFLVVAPTSVVPGWVREAARHTPGLTVRAVTATGRRRGAAIGDLAADADLVVTSYALLRLEAEQYAAQAWGGLVLDEAQQVKNHTGKTHQAVRALDTPFRVALTGTPFENRLTELWSLLAIVAPGLYPSSRKFKEHVATPVEKQADVAALQRFRTRVRPFLLRRTKELVAADLPPKQEQVLDVTLHPAHRKVYDAHLQHERQAILGLLGDFDRNRVAIFSSLTRLRQLSLDAGLVDPEHAGVGSAKLEVLVEHLRELVAEGHRALVFSQFTRYLGLVRERLAAEGIEVVYLDGRTRDRDAVISQFKDGTAPVFLISLKAGGVGLNLTEADYVFVLDPWWNPAVEAQAVDRAHRIGQERPVMVYRLVATDTIEEKVMELKERKAALFAQVVDGDGAMSAAVTADDVRALLGDVEA